MVGRRARRRHQLLRHRRHLRRDQERDLPGRGAGRPAGRDRAGHQVRRPLRGPRGRGLRRLHPHRGRGQPDPARHRPHRPVPAARARPEDADRRDASARWPSSSPRARSASSAAPTSRVAMLDGGRRGHAGRRARASSACRTSTTSSTASPRTASSSAATAPGMAFLPYFPLASGLLSGKYRAGEPPPEGTRLAAMGDRAAEPADRRAPGHRGRPRRAGPSARATACWTSPSAGCCRGPPWPRSSPAPPGPSRSPPTSPPGTWRPGAEVLAAVDAIAPR